MFLRLTTAALAVCACLGAQRPASWNALNVPAGVDPYAVMQLGKLVTYREGGNVHVYSAFSRKWKTRAISGSASLRNANDWLLIREGNTFTAFSSMRGTFQSITLSSSAYVVNPVSQRNDSILLVADGTDLWAFSGLQGSWVRRPISFSASLSVQRHVAIIADGRTLAGMSAFAGTWITRVTLLPVSQVYTDGTVGIAYNDSSVYGFSAQRGTWQETSAPAPGAAFAGKADVAVWADGSQLLGFSGLRGNFSTYATSTPVSLFVDQQVAVASGSRRQFFFSAATGQWTVFTTQQFPIIRTAAATVLIQSSGSVHAYSALSGRVASIPVRASSTDVNWGLATAIDQWTGAVWLYSAFTGTWQRPPPGPPFTLPRLAFQAALVDTDNGYAAFSGRTGRFVPVVVGGGAVPHVDPNSGVVAIEDSQSLHIFEPRRDLWLQQPLQPSLGPLQVQIWRTSLIATQGMRAYGYGSQTGEIEAFNLPQPVTGIRASSESISLLTQDNLVAFSSVPDLNTHWQFPEFRRMYVADSPAELQMHGPTGSIGVILVGLPGPATAYLPAGPLVLSPAPVAQLWFGSVLPAERAIARFRVPDLPGFNDVTFGFQGVILDPASQLWLTRMCTLYIP